MFTGPTAGIKWNKNCWKGIVTQWWTSVAFGRQVLVASGLSDSSIAAYSCMTTMLSNGSALSISMIELSSIRTLVAIIISCLLFRWFGGLSARATISVAFYFLSPLSLSLDDAYEYAHRRGIQYILIETRVRYMLARLMAENGLQVSYPGWPCVDIQWIVTLRGAFAKRGGRLWARLCSCNFAVGPKKGASYTPFGSVNFQPASIPSCNMATVRLNTGRGISCPFSFFRPSFRSVVITSDVIPVSFLQSLSDKHENAPTKCPHAEIGGILGICTAVRHTVTYLGRRQRRDIFSRY